MSKRHIHLHIHRARTTDQQHRDGAGRFSSGGSGADVGGKKPAASTGHPDLVRHTSGMIVHRKELKKYPGGHRELLPHEHSAAEADYRKHSDPKYKQATTKDAGDFDESKHKRDEGGKFATSSGNAEHHEAESKRHGKEWAAKGKDHPDGAHHAMAQMRHQQAAASLQNAARAHALGASSKIDTEAAESYAQQAAKHEANIGRSGEGNTEAPRAMSMGNARARVAAAHAKAAAAKQADPAAAASQQRIDRAKGAITKAKAKKVLPAYWHNHQADIKAMEKRLAGMMEQHNLKFGKPQDK